jgi:outer membrane lipoprotein SlyB
MKILRKSLISLLLITSLSGCATSNGYNNDYAYRNTVTGAAVGAAGGALVGYAAGDGKGALLGGTLGAVAGGAAGYYYDKQRENDYNNRPYYQDNSYNYNQNQSSYAPAKRRSHRH